MAALRKVIAVFFWLISALLVYAVIHAVTSAEGARIGVAIGYIIGAFVLSGLGWWLWRSSGKPVADEVPAP